MVLLTAFACDLRIDFLRTDTGALAAVFGLIVGVVLAVVLVLFGAVLGEGVAEVVVLPASVGSIDAMWAFSAILFLINLFGGLIGGKLGEPSRPDLKDLE